MLHDRTGNPHPLPLSTRQRVGALIGEAGEADRIEQVECLLNILGRKLAQPRLERRHIAESPRQHVFHHGQSLDQVVFLKHHADFPARGAQPGPFQFGQIHALK